MTANPRRPLVLLAVGGPVLFTVAWLVLGALTPGYSQRAGTISALAAYGAAHGLLMVTAFLLQGVAQVTGGRLAARVLGARWVGAALVVAGAGTLAAGVLRLPGPESQGPSWSAAAHAAAATAAFAGLHLAALAAVLHRWPQRTAGERRLLRAAPALALAVALLHLAWFLAQLGDPGPWFGYAEKMFTTVLLAWSVLLMVRVWRQRASTQGTGTRGAGPAVTPAAAAPRAGRAAR